MSENTSRRRAACLDGDGRTSHCLSASSADELLAFAGLWYVKRNRSMSDSKLSHHSSRRSLRERLATRERSPVVSTIPPAPEVDAESSSVQQHTTTHAEHHQDVHSGGADEDEVMRQPDLWFSDGSIVLRAENRMFRVHVSQLSRHSEVFSDMLSMPQPTATIDDEHGQADRIEGCPVLLLHDKAEDVMHLLRALYDGP